MYTLWAYGAMQRSRQLMSGGVARGLTVVDEHAIARETVDGSYNSSFVPSPSGAHLFIFEWDKDHNLKYVVELKKSRRKRRRR